MAYSRVIKTGNGVTNQFVVDFALGYLEQDDVKCRVGTEADGSGNPVYRTITFLSETLMQISGAAPGNGVQVVFERTVEKTDTIIHFSDGDVLDEANLDLAFKQAMMMVHEVLDGRFGAFNADVDFGNFKLLKVGTPTASTDGANKAYVDSKINTSTTNTTNAQSAAAAAANSQTAAAGSASAAATSATAAAGSASAALASQNAAASSATAAAGSATTANSHKNAAATSATSAATSATNADASEANALAYSNTAVTKASEAAASAASADTSEANALSSAIAAELSKDNAYKWASEAEDVLVDDGEHPTGYSAYHWALKAQEVLVTAGVTEVAGLAGVVLAPDLKTALDIFDVTSGSHNGKMDKSANLNDVANKATARSNLGTHDAANLTTGVVPAARITGAYGNFTTIGASGLVTVTADGEVFRAAGSATGDPYMTFYKASARQGYIQHTDGTNDGAGFRFFNDLTDDYLYLHNVNTIDALRFYDASTALHNVVWHSGNQPITTASTGNTLAKRDSSGDIHARLFRSEYDTTNGTVGYIMTQINTTTDNYIRPSTPAQVAAALGPILTADKVETNVSGEFTPVLAGLITWAHGLGAKPTMIDLFMICKTAEHGWAVNDEFGPIGNNIQYSDRWVHSLVWADSTNVYVRTQNTSGGNYVFPAIVNQDTGQPVYATAANWRLKIKVRK
ncbi:tail fiber protein [Rhizobium phage RHph_X3_9]|nr:tail fiber protein [Rhizobium phage RHph_X3_9]